MKEIHYRLLMEGYKALQKPDDPEPRLRGGNSGCFVGEDCIAGADPRIALLRFFGIDINEGFDKALMFDDGFANEDIIVAQLKASGKAVFCEEEVPTRWDANGIPVTGRPDAMVGRMAEECDQMGKSFLPEYGLEFKKMCSVFSLLKTAHFTAGEPKSDHIIQGAHYSWQKNYLPWVLHYTSRNNWSIPFFAQKPSKTRPEGYFLDPDHRAIKKDEKGKPYNLEPFVSLYDLTWEGDTLFVDDMETNVTGEGIREFYNYLTLCINERMVPDIQTLYDFRGNRIPADKNDTIKYYKFGEAREDSGFDNWLKDCKIIAKEASVV